MGIYFAWRGGLGKKSTELLWIIHNTMTNKIEEDYLSEPFLGFGNMFLESGFVVQMLHPPICTYMESLS